MYKYNVAERVITSFSGDIGTGKNPKFDHPDEVQFYREKTLEVLRDNLKMESEWNIKPPYKPPKSSLILKGLYFFYSFNI